MQEPRFNIQARPRLFTLSDAILLCLGFWLLSVITLRIIAFVCSALYKQPFIAAYATLIYEPLALASAQALAAAAVTWCMHVSIKNQRLALSDTASATYMWVGASALAGLCAQWPLSKLSELMQSWFTHDAFYERLPLLLDTPWQKQGLLLLALVVLPATSEELIFRGALYRFVRTRSTPVYAIVLTAILFSLSHGLTIALVPALVAGVALGMIRERTRAISPCIAFHAGVNLAPFLVSYLTR